MKYKYNLYFILFVGLLAGISVGMGHPVTPQYVRSLNVPDYVFGLFFSTMSIGLLVGSPLFGVLGDRFGFKRFIMLSFFGYAFGQLLFGLNSNIFLLLIFRFMSGFFSSAQITLFPALISNYSDSNNRTKYLSIYVALNTVGSSIGYKIGGYLGLMSINRVFVYQAIYSLILVVVILIFLKDYKALDVNKIKPKSNPLTVFKQNKAISLFLIALVIATIGQVITTKYLDIYMIDNNYNSNDLGNMALVSGGVILLTNFIVVPYISRHNKDFFYIKVSLLITGIMASLLVIGTNLLFNIYTFYMIFIIAKSIFTPFEQSYISKQSNQNHGAIMGLRQSLISLGYIIGPLLGGFLYNINPKFVFYSSFILVFMAFIIILIYQKQNDCRNL